MRHIPAVLLLPALLLFLASCEQKPAEPQKQAAPEKAAAAPSAVPEVKKSAKPVESPGPVRPPAVAGQFYPGDPGQLTAMVDGFLDNVRQDETQGKIIGLICPHAGYVYSGHVAAYSYNQIKGRHYDTVVLIGLGHRGSPGMVSIYPSGAYETPLGKVPVNGEMAAKIMMDHRDLIRYQEFADAPEHSVEVQLPFLQRVLKDFRIVPILITECSQQECETVARAVADACRGENVLLVASSDLSHFPAYDDAVRVDKEVMQSWLTMDPATILAKDRELMMQGVPNLACSACGRDAVVTVIMASKLLGADKVRLLKYANAGDASGDRSRVVGYGAAVLYQSEKAKAGAPPAAPPPAAEPAPVKAESKAAAPAPSDALSAEQRKKLLSLARAAIEAAIKGEPITPAKITDPGRLQEHDGAFVTIKNHGQLRGCIGDFVAHEPLYQVVQKMAIASATQDYRFFGNQLTPAELKDIDIEISVLSPRTPIADPMKIELGKHGIYIVNEKQGAAGCFLPQVATETGWSKEEFLSHCASDKAGLPPDSWKNDPDTKVLVFTAEVFGEKE